MEKLQIFEGPKIAAVVALAKRQHYPPNYWKWEEGEELKVKDGVISIPEGAAPRGFYINLFSPANARAVFVQRNLTRRHGEYADPELTRLSEMFAEDWDMVEFHLPILVDRFQDQVFTAWKGIPEERRRRKQIPEGLASNKIDCWLLDEEGHLDLFQVGIVTHDNGKSWRLLGEYRWRGKLFRANGAIVGKPKKPVWGDFKVREEILRHPEFRDHLKEINLSAWKGRESELNPLLDPVPQGLFARVDFYSSFMGHTGQGLAKLDNGSTAWVHGSDVISSPNGDGIRRLQRNDLIRYSATASFGNSAKLLCVEKVQT